MIAVLYCMYHMCLCPVLGVCAATIFWLLHSEPMSGCLVELTEPGFSWYHRWQRTEGTRQTIGAAWAHADKSEHHNGMSIYKEGEQQMEKAVKFP